MKWINPREKLPKPGQIVMIYDGNVYEVATYLGSDAQFEHSGHQGKKLSSHDGICNERECHRECRIVYWAMQTCECCNDVDKVTHWSYFEMLT